MNILANKNAQIAIKINNHLIKLRQHKLSWPLPHHYIELISHFPIIQPTLHDQSILALVGLFLS